MNSIVLASASPRRKQLFEMMNISVRIDPSDSEEIVDPEVSAEENVRLLAKQKAHDVAKRHQNSLLVAADTIVVSKNKILGKPSDKAEASGMLRSLSGGHHWVYSGVSVLQIDAGGEIKDELMFSEKTKVTFCTLEDFEIDNYVATGSPMDKAGAYGIQDDYGSLFIKKIEGDYYNVVGFPVNKFYQTMKSSYPYMFKKIFNL